MALSCALLLLGCGALDARAQQGPDRGRPRSLAEEVERLRGSHGFTLLSGRTPRILFLNRDRHLRLDLLNDGKVSWSPEEAFSVSYHWLSPGGEMLQKEGPRTAVPQKVAPGQRVRLSVLLKPPQRAGLYLFQWDMVQEHVCWFTERDPSPERLHWVLVLPRVERLLGALAPLAGALLGLLLVEAARRRQENAALAFAASLGDLFWCALSLAAKPFLLYGEMSLTFAPGAHWIAFSCVAFSLLVLLPLPWRVRPWIAWLATAWTSVYVWGDLLYFRFFSDLASVSALRAVRQTGELSESMRYLAQGHDAWLVPDLALGLLLVARLTTWLPRKSARPRLPRRLLAGMLLVALLPGLQAVGSARADAVAGKRMTLPPLVAVERYGLYGFQLRDLSAQLRKRLAKLPLGDQEFAEIVLWFEERAPQRAGRGPWYGVAEGKNLLILQVESMQQFVLGLQIADQEVTPILNRWRSSALAFNFVRDQTSKGRSSDADYVNFASILPVADSVGYEYPANQHVTLAHALRERSYRTVSAIPFTPTFWNRQVTHPAYGFEVSLFKEDFEVRREDRIGWGLNDLEFLRQMHPRIEAWPRPFCGWLSTLSLHYPYSEFPDEPKVLELGVWEGTSLGNYLHGMNFFDRAFGELMAALESTGLLEETVVALWGDHDSALAQRHEFADVLEVIDAGPGRFLMDLVPLLIWVPGVDAPRGEVDRIAGHTDIAPTLLALLGVDPAGYAFAGRNLLGEPGSSPMVHPKGSWVDERWVYLNEGEGLGGGTCWNRRTLQEVDVAACEAGNRQSVRQLEISRKVLLYDLQRRITDRLQDQFAATASRKSAGTSAP